MADVTFRRGVEANLPTSGMATEGCIYQSTDTGNMYVGSSQGTLIPVNRSPYYGTCPTQAGTNAKVVTLDVENDNFTMKAGVMISVLFTYANTAVSPTLNVNNKGAVAIKLYGPTNVSASPRAWEAGEVVTFVHNGTYWLMVGHKVQSDWNQADAAAEDFIKNKPTIPTINESLSSNYGVCSSAAATVAKTVTVNNSDFELSDGVRVKVKFNKTNSAENPTLAVNGTVAKPIVTRGAESVGRGYPSSWREGSVVEMTYDGTSWVIDGWLNNNDMYYAGGSNVVIEDIDPFGEYNALDSIYNSSSTSFSTDKTLPNQNEVFIDIRYKERSTLGSFYLFGSANGSYADWRYGIVRKDSSESNKFHLCWREKNGAYLESTIPRVASHVYRIKACLHNGTAKLYVLDETTGMSDTVSTTYDITNVRNYTTAPRLFAGGSSSYYATNGIHICYVKVESNGTPFINYMPMRRKSDNMVGFLDTVSCSFLSSDSGNVDENKLNAGALIDRPDNHIIKVSTTVDDSNFVHKTDAETVGGEKTFTDNLKIGAGKVIDLAVGNDEGVYIQASSDSNGKQIAFGDDGDDSEVRLVNVAAPIDGLDAANKAYVDAAIEGGSSGITLPLAVADGGTGGSTAKGAEYRLTPNLATNSTAEITDTARIPFVRSSPSATNGRFSGYKTALLFWNYIYDKISSLFGISYDSNDEGVPLAPTAAAGTNTTQIATTAFVNTATSGLAIDNNVVHKSNQEHIVGYKYFDGGFESSYIAKTNGTSSQFLKADGSVDSNTYVTSADIPSPSSRDPLMDGRASSGSETKYSREDHVHPSDTSRVPTTRKVNNKPLSSDITLTASDVGALPSNTFIPNDSNLVHKTGNENIGGTKTFNNNVVLGTSANLYFGTGQDEGVYVEAWEDGSGGQSLMFASLEDDSEVRLENIATPVYNTDAANKQYVDNATSGLAVDANVVHKTGNESIGGTKTFSSNVVLGANANLVLSTAQDEGVYIEANSSSGGQQALIFSSLDDDSAVKLENVALPTANSDAANKQYVDDAIGNTYVSLKGTTNASAQETYSVYPYSLCAFSTYVYPQTYMIMTSLVLSGGLSNKTPYSAHWFPIGCKIYYYNEGTALNGAFSSQRFYTTYNGVDARYSAVTGDNIDLFSDVSGGPVYLRVEIRENNSEWRPYHEQGETNEIIVSGAQLEVGGFYIYLGRSAVSSDYMFQLEDNNPLYACVMDGSGTHLVDWASYNSSRTPYLVKRIQLFPSSQFPIGSNPIIGNTGIYSRQSYLDSSYLEGVYKVTLQLHAWWDYPKGTLDTPQPLSVIVKHNTNDKIAGGSFVIPVIESPNDVDYKMGTVVVNLTGFVTFTSAQTYQDYIEVKVQGAKGINLGGEHPLWGSNEGDVEYNDGLILERIDWYNPT